MPFDYGLRLDNRQRIANAGEKPIKANKNQAVDGAEGVFLRSGSPQNVYLLPQHPNFHLERCPRPKQICDDPNNEPDEISHHATASPNSRSTASQIEFATGTPMSTASAEARAQCAVRLRISHRPGRSPRRQRNPGDQDRCRARPARSERTENSRGDHVCSRSGSRASTDASPSNRIRPCGELMPPGLFGSTTIDWSGDRKSKHPRDGRRNRGGRRLRACLENGCRHP